MAKKEIKIDLNKILNDVDNMPQSEVDLILDIADTIYSYLDVPVVMINEKEIKSNMLLIAMYLIGKEAGRLNKSK